MENQRLTKLVILMGFLAVALGAFGAHALKPLMDEAGINNFNTANRYHFYHTLLALLLVLTTKEKQRYAEYSIIFALLGILFFSGSLYIMALRYSILTPSWLPILTPIGGFCFLLAWTALLLNFIYLRKKI